MLRPELAEVDVRDFVHAHIERALQRHLPQPFVRAAALLATLAAHHERAGRHELQLIPRGLRLDGRRGLLQRLAAIGGDELVFDEPLEPERRRHRAGERNEACPCAPR